MKLANQNFADRLESPVEQHRTRILAERFNRTDWRMELRRHIDRLKQIDMLAGRRIEALAERAISGDQGAFDAIHDSLDELETRQRRDTVHRVSSVCELIGGFLDG